MKIALISVLSSDDASQNGVWSKMCAIQQGLKELFHECDVFHFSSAGLQKNSNPLIVTDKHKKNRGRFILNNYLPLLESYLLDYDLLWIRHAFFGPSILTVLKRLKHNNPKLKIVYELPTYPYIYEFNGLKKIAVKFHEHLIMHRLVGFVDKIITYSNDQRLYNIATIPISNGIVVKDYPVKISSKSKGSINLIAIGVLWDWYGLDRIIKGLSSYKINSGTRVCLSIVGEGKEMNNLKRIVEKLNLESDVKFLGWKNKMEIDELSNTHDIGVGTLAIHRKNVKINASLKHREYTARGLPFVFAGCDNDFTSGCPFTYMVSSSDEPINISKLLFWFDNLENESAPIRMYAELNLDWTSKLSQVLTSI